MKNPVILILFLLSCIITLQAQKIDQKIEVIRPKQGLAPGRACTFHVKGIPEAKKKDGTPQAVPFVVYLPKNYTKDKKWPVIMEWHGAGGCAGVPISRTVTGGNDFICIGLTYINAKAATEEKYVSRVYNTAIQFLNGDPKVVFPGGFSFGGLAQERFLLNSKTIGRYRGVWMFGAGFVRPNNKMKKWLVNTPFFVAVGEKDFNRKPVEAALTRFKQVVKSVEFYIMPGVGHTVDFKFAGPRLKAFFIKLIKNKKTGETKDKK